MSRISLSRKYAETLLGALTPKVREAHLTGLTRAIDALRSALAPKRTKPMKRERLAKKRSAKAEKNAETKEIRAEVVMRSRGCCEACGTSFGVGMPAELDHFWGRVRVAQSDENCWLLCWLCHRQKTNNTPSAAHWLRAFVAHAERYGFIAEAAKARARLESDALVEQAREVGR